MAVESGLRVEGALVGHTNLVYRVVVDFLCLLGLHQLAGGQRVERQSHEDAIEPHLVAVDGLVPVDLVLDGARLVLQLLHHKLHGQEVFLLRVVLVHPRDEVASADVVEVVVFQAEAPDVAVAGNHRVGVFAAVGEDVIAAVFQIGVEHGFQLDAHHVAPLGTFGEVEQVGLGHALHLGVGEPLAVVLEGLLLQRQRTVEEEVLKAHIARLSLDAVALAHTVEAAVLDVDVVDVAEAVECDDQHTILRLSAGDVFEVDVAHGGVVAPAANLVVLVVEVDFQYALLAHAHLNITHVDVLNDATAAGVGLDAHDAIQVGRVHHVVLRIDVAATTRNLRADDHTAVAVLHLAVADDDVLAGAVPEPSVAVASALDGDAVVARVEEAVLNEHAVARLRVAAVAVGPVVGNLHPAHGDVLRQQGMDDPKGRAQQGEVLHQDVLTLIEVDELRAQAVLLGEDALVHVHAVLGLLQQSGARATALVGQQVGCAAEVG